MPVPSAISDLSQTAGSNYPAGSESPTTADDYLRTYASYIAKLRDGQGFTAPVTLASATTTDIGGQVSHFVDISGTTTITSFGTNYNGPRYIRFTGALTLTHNATSLILPTGANITTVAGDSCIAYPNAALNGWTVVSYAGKSGQFATITANGGAFNGTVGATTPSTGAFTTLSATGAISQTASSGNPTLTLSGSGAYTSVVTLNGGSGGSGYITSGSGASLRLNAPTGQTVTTEINNTTVTNTSSTGLAVTGALSATGNVSTTNGTYQSSNGTQVGVFGAGAFTAGTVGIGSSSNYPLVFGTNSSEVARFSTDGNLGLGVTPSAWNSARKAIEAADYGLVSGGGSYQLANNAYLNSSGTWIYKTSTLATVYESGGGAHRWYTAPSGTAGNAITFTQAMVLTADPYLLIGYTSSNGAYKLQVNSQIFATSSTIATSDGRYKENVTPIAGALSLVQALNPVTFTWKKHEVHDFPSGTTTGFIAQEVQAALAGTSYLSNIVKSNICTLVPAEYETVELSPEIAEIKDQDGVVITESVPAVTEQRLIKEAVTEEFLGIAEGNLISLLTAAIKELKAEFDAYKESHP